jgi:predicted ArsR family transcriptional regulator
MNDPVLELFSWLTPLFNHESLSSLSLNTKERAILLELQNEWGKVDTVELLKQLSAQYGIIASEVAAKVIAYRIKEDWAALGKIKANHGTEINDFINTLWEPLREQGFHFEYKTSDSQTVFCVKRCPVYELAKVTGLYEWFYYLACATDYHTAPAFSSNIQFKRTKTLMEGNNHCDHTYSYREC